MELPVFYGDNALAWIDECESIVHLTGIQNEAKIKWANAHIRGKAKVWLSSSGVNLYLLNWTQFCDLLCDRFPPPGEHESMEQFQQLKQTTSVNNYIDRFEEHMWQMKTDHLYLTDNFFLLRFLTGLKESVKHSVKSHNPSTLRAAYWHARQQEQAYLATTKKQATVSSNQRNSNFLPRPNNLNRDNKPWQVQEKPRDQNKCWYYPEPWVFGHRCANVKSMLNAIEMQGHSDNDTQAEVVEKYQDAQPNLPPDIAILDTIQQDPVPVLPNNECLMQISAEALHGIPGQSTLSVLVHINGHQVVALVDSGSTNTFVDTEFANKAKIPITNTTAHTVLVVGGGELQSPGCIPNCTFKIQNTEFVYDCKILPLKGYDMVLGANWLKHHGPNFTDWEKRSIAVTVNGEWLTLFDRIATQQQSIISSKTCSKLLLGGAQVFLIRLTTKEHQETNVSNPILAMPANSVEDILTDFTDVFTEPTGLPPPRPCDHTIPIKEGSNPPNIRPYRMPHKQKILWKNWCNKCSKTRKFG
jgi:hypothetical protein